jgi:hypothetical protein
MKITPQGVRAGASPESTDSWEGTMAIRMGNGRVLKLRAITFVGCIGDEELYKGYQSNGRVIMLTKQGSRWEEF